MFDGLLGNDINVFATTASNPTESSYACYYDDLRQTYLGDVYSVKWMEDSDAEILTKESLQEQYSIVKKETTTSQVEEYGNLNMSSLMVSEFQGQTTPSVSYRSLPRVHLDAVNSREVPLAILRRKLEAAVDEESRQEAQKNIDTIQRNRQFLKEKVREIIKVVTSRNEDGVEELLTAKATLKNRNCYHSVVKAFHTNCFDLAKNEYALVYTRVMANLCDSGHLAREIIGVINKVCTHPKIVGIH